MNPQQICPQCHQPVPASAVRCPQCGYPLFAPAGVRPASASDIALPSLWNPKAAATLSLFLSPAFGAYLHSRNWSTLGEPERARTSLMWMWAFFVILLGYIGSLLLNIFPNAPVMNVIGIIFYFSWYFFQARHQMEYVESTLGTGYIKRGFGKPIFATLGVMVIYLVAIVITPAPQETPDEVAIRLKPDMLRAMQKDPTLIGATIEKITLHRKYPNSYTGTVDATVRGIPQRWNVEVTREGKDLLYKVQPMGR